MNLLKKIFGSILYLVGLIFIIVGSVINIGIPIVAFLNGFAPTVALAMLFILAPLLITSFILIFSTSKWYSALPGMVICVPIWNFSNFIWIIFIGYVLVLIKKLLFKSTKPSVELISDPFSL